MKVKFRSSEFYACKKWINVNNPKRWASVARTCEIMYRKRKMINESTLFESWKHCTIAWGASYTRVYNRDIFSVQYCISVVFSIFFWSLTTQNRNMVRVRSLDSMVRSLDSIVRLLRSLEFNGVLLYSNLPWLILLWQIIWWIWYCRSSLPTKRLQHTRPRS